MIKDDWLLEPETAAAIIRMTGGNFRLLNRLLTQIERLLQINALHEVTKAVVEAARESLVMGEWRTRQQSLSFRSARFTKGVKS
jgi:hypothetical protein